MTQVAAIKMGLPCVCWLESVWIARMKRTKNIPELGGQVNLSKIFTDNKP
jgi:hypothetical protein